MEMRKAVGNSAGFRGQSKGRDSNGSTTNTLQIKQYNITLNKHKLKENMKLPFNR